MGCRMPGPLSQLGKCICLMLASAGSRRYKNGYRLCDPIAFECFEKSESQGGMVDFVVALRSLLASMIKLCAVFD